MRELWHSRPLRKLGNDRWATICLAIICAYGLVSVLVAFDALGDHARRVGDNYMQPSWGSWRTFLGTDRQGRSILVRVLYSAKVAFQVGFVAALVGVAVGTLLGGLAGYFGKWVDALIVWLYSTVQSIPYLLLLIAIAYAIHNIEGIPKGKLGIYIAFSATFWVGPCRIVRGEVLKLREAEYVQAATALGYGRMRVLFRHVLPNTLHLILVNFALLFVGAIKSEVILSYLGLGVVGEPSWGTMIDQARAELINGFYWQIGAATVAMFGLILSFNIFADALGDALDPKTL